ncbi:MAG: ATP-binding protein [Euryarchaeota archaeon]|nr:ATP-binding protein [Euryarchaeota archaeon]
MEKKELLNELDLVTKDNIARVLWMREFDAEKIPEDVIDYIKSDKNSAKSFGERMQYRLQDMINYPDSFTPSYKKRYKTFIKHSEFLTPLQAYVMTHLLGLDSSRGYEKIPDEADLTFPQHHVPQLGYQVGWHFFVGNCVGENNKEYGILFLLYRYSLLPPPIARHFGLSDLENQIFEFQLAVAEAGNRHYQAKPLAVAGTTGLVKFSNEPFSYYLGKNTARSLQNDSLFPIRLQGWGINLEEESTVEIQVDLTLSSTKDFLLQGNKGCLPCCCGIGTLYYSATNLKLKPNSILKLKGEEIKLKEGKFWFDHQWGNSLEPLGNSRCELVRAASNMVESHSRGWDWFMGQFDGEREITMAAPHRDENCEFYEQTGPNPPGVMTVNVTGHYIDEKSKATKISGHLEVSEWVKSEKSSDPNQYQITHTWYPNKWNFSFGEDVPEDIRSFTMVPIVKTGQSGFNASGAQYSEGGVYIKDKKGNLIGRGFAESVYYANGVKNMLSLSGLPVTPKMLDLVRKPSPLSFLKIRSFLTLAWPANRAKIKKILLKCVEQGLPTSMIG